MAVGAKPQSADGYSAAHTHTCEQVLVTLLSAFGSLKDTIRLVGGLVPRYLTPEQYPDVPAHFGTSDVDVALNLSVLASGNYTSLSKQLLARGFKRWVDPKNGWDTAWRWEYQISAKQVVLVEFLRGSTDDCPPSKIAALDGEDVSALSVQHMEIVHDWYESRKIEAEMLGDRGVTIETVHYADVPAFIILKALAFHSRAEKKDSGDLIHVMRYAGPLEDVVGQFVARAKSGLHAEAIKACRIALKERFCSTLKTEGHDLIGPKSYAQFMLGKGADEEELVSEARYASGLIEIFLKLLERDLGPVE
ncbi:hypothetical protein [Pseudomonas sp. WHRI 8519]|uniref:hypothetical protein n=1 Tax=Pseudomonas sp. WHRI 8519 TaxID=3162567 RepID=UPI0032F03F46